MPFSYLGYALVGGLYFRMIMKPHLIVMHAERNPVVQAHQVNLNLAGSPLLARNHLSKG